jgi:hypothetical protein
MRGTCSPWHAAHDDETVGTTKTIGIDKYDPARLVDAIGGNDKYDPARLVGGVTGVNRQPKYKQAAAAISCSRGFPIVEA